MVNSRRCKDTLPADQQAIREWCFHPTGIFIEFKEEDLEQSIPDRFEDQVGKFASKVAVRAGSLEVTYDALNKRANCIANRILSEVGEGSEPIVLLMDQSISAIAAIFGVLKAGKFYVPLDESLQPDSIVRILQDAGSKLILTDTRSWSLGSKLATGKCRAINIEELQPSQRDEQDLKLPILPDTLANIYYTSGTTGQPKGVLLTHRTALHYIMTHSNDIRITSDDKLTLLQGPSSGAGSRQIFASLLNGSSICLFDVPNRGLASLADWLIKEGITVYLSTPTVFRSWVQMLNDQRRFPQIRLLRLGSEQIGIEDVDFFRKHFSKESVLQIGYASSEVHQIARYFIAQGSHLADRIPLGYPLDGVEIMILDEGGRKADLNQAGEIAVKSNYLAAGYWRKPDLTNSAFLTDPDGGQQRIYLTGDLGRIAADGCLEFLGRKDFQVKIRGYPVNVAEIEQSMRRDPLVRDVLVISKPSSLGGHQLVAYVVPKASPGPTVRALRESLSRSYPDYKIPSHYVFVDSFPLLPGGKVDRRALPEIGIGRPELEVPFVAPRTASEEKLARIWAEVLGLEQVGIHDSFLELGGNSLLASQVISRVIQIFRVDLPLRCFFESSTIAEMEVVIVQSQVGKVEEEDIQRMLAEL